MKTVFAVFLPILFLLPALRGRAASFEPGEWVWCDVETNFAAAPHSSCPGLGGGPPAFCEFCQMFHRPETPENPHVHIGRIAANPDPGPDEKTESGTEETIDPPATGSGDGGTDGAGVQGGPASEKDVPTGPGPTVVAAVAATLALVVAAAFARRRSAKRKNRSAPVRRRRIPWRWKDGIPQGLELLSRSLVCHPESGIDGGTAMVYDAMFLDEDGWVPAIVKRIVGKGLRQSDRFPMLRFEAAVLERLDGVESVPRLLAGPFQNASVGAETWSFYAMSPATGRLWPDKGGLGRDTRQALYALCEALEKMHERGVGHHDLKPQNVFWDPKTKSVTIIDFGSAVCRGGGPSNPIGSTYPKSEPWVAPATDGKCLALLTPASDAWVYGLMFCEALVGGIADRSHWPENPDDREWLRGRLAAKTSPAVADAVADGLFAIDPARRKTLQEFWEMLQKEWDL